MSARTVASAIGGLILCVGLSPTVKASPIDVTFVVRGAPDDPIYGSQTALGTFRFDSSLVRPGAIVQNTGAGLDALSIAFNWAGGKWSAANADLSMLQFNHAGALTSWALGGELNGLASVHVTELPDFLINGGSMLYSTPSGLFLGSRRSFTVDIDPEPMHQVSEPASLLLVGSGIAAVAGGHRVRRLRQHVAVRRVARIPG